MRAIIAFLLRFCGLSLLLALAACGGGGGGGGGSAPPVPTFATLTPGTLTFSAANPSAAVPPSQTITATMSGLTSGTLYIRIVIDGVVVTSVTNLVVNPAAQQGTASVNVGAPGNLGTGPHPTSITVIACLNDINCAGPQLAGSPKTINVAYTVGSSVQGDAVAPYVGTSGVAGDVVIRGHGFAAGTTVSFNGIPATARTFVSDTEIHATYPLLSANSYPVILDSGATAFTKALTIVDAPAYASTTLSYPAAPQEIVGFAYDAERKALLVGVTAVNAANNQILRYQFATGAWSADLPVMFADLRNFALSLDGSRLLAIADTALAEVDPVTLATPKTTPKPTNPNAGANEYLKSVAVANDGNAVVTTGYKNGSGSTQLYLYSGVSGFSTPALAGTSPFNIFYYAMPAASGDGATVVIAQPGLTPATPFYRYLASPGTLAPTNHSLEHREIPPVLDRTGSRMVTTSIIGTFTVTFDAYDSNFAHLGSLPTTTGAYAVKPDGSRAYTFENNTGTCQVRAFDLVNIADPLTEIGTGFPITIPCAGDALPPNVKMIVDPAGDTLFLAGKTQIVVVPLP